MFKHDLGDGADLRILETRHAAAFLESVDENRAYWGAWLDWVAQINTVEDAQTFIKRGITRFAEDGLPWVGIWLDERLVGGVLFFPVNWRIRSTDIGYWLAESATGQSLMSRAVLAMLGFAFDALQLNRVGLQAEVVNTRSRALAERLEFTSEGIRRSGWVRNGRYVDMTSYSMLASDWQERTR